MIITLILALFLLLVVFTRTTSKRRANESFVKHHLKLIIASSVVILTIVTMNVFRPRVYTTNLDEVIEKAEENNRNYLALEKRNARSLRAPSNIPYLFEYVKASENLQSISKAGLQNETFSRIPKLQRLALAYVDALIPDSSFKAVYQIGPDGIYDENYPDTTMKFHNFVIGQQKLTDQEVTEAIIALNRELKLNPNYDETYPLLRSAYQRYSQKSFRNFVINPINAKHLDQNLLVEDYFKLGEYYLYIKTLYTNRFIDPNIFALIAGLIISIIWMIFLRNLDFFNKERWIDLFIVFVGGAFFTILCHFIYDFAYYNLGIGLNGEAWNDFFYCVGIIGFSEELIKLIPWILFAFISKRLKEPYDYILYASVAALGFAFTENLNYLESPNNIVIRFITSTSMHMFAASLVAYCMVLAKYKYKSKQAKIIAPFIGFALACVAHGFYDYWIISASANGLEIITLIFFFLTIHIWFYMINNSTNQSSFFDKTLLRINENIEFLSISILGIILLQYIILCIEYGAISANTMLRYGTTLTIGFLLYVTFILTNFRAIKGKWIKYSFPLSKLINQYIDLPFTGSSSSESHIGLHLRIFCPKDNKYIGHQLPVSGHCERKIRVNNEENWYLFRLNQGIELNGHHSHLVILKPKSKEDELTEEKIEIYLMFIPLNTDVNVDNISVKHLRYTGKTYSKPTF